MYKVGVRLGGSARVVGDPVKSLLASKGSLYLAGGCELCIPGVKAVIFVTGLCDDSCFYCPVSRSKLGYDVFYVNERRVYSVEEAVAEVARMGAEGASLTGGDPLLPLHRTLPLISALKDNMGGGFHIHLYTSGRRAYGEVLRALWRAGLDEIRFHPTSPDLVERVGLAKRVTGLRVGVEIPIAPGMEEWAVKVISKAERLGADFVNLNEMEIVEPNARALLARGYRESSVRPFTVEGSLEAALKVLEWASENSSIPVHFCPASFKDGLQTGNRLRRTAERDLYWYEEATDSGTVVWGELRGSLPSWLRALACRPGAACLPPRPRALEVLAEKLGLEAYIVEAHPTADRRPVVREVRLL